MSNCIECEKIKNDMIRYRTDYYIYSNLGHFMQAIGLDKRKKVYDKIIENFYKLWNKYNDKPSLKNSLSENLRTDLQKKFKSEILMLETIFKYPVINLYNNNKHYIKFKQLMNAFANEYYKSILYTDSGIDNINKLGKITKQLLKIPEIKQIVDDNVYILEKAYGKNYITDKIYFEIIAFLDDTITSKSFA